MFIAHEKTSENKETLPISSVASWVVSTEPAQHDPQAGAACSAPSWQDSSTTALMLSRTPEGFFIAPPSCCYEFWVLFLNSEHSGSLALCGVCGGPSQPGQALSSWCPVEAESS